MDVKELYVLLTANTTQFKAAMGEASALADSAGLSIGKMKGLGALALVGGAVEAGKFLIETVAKYQEATDKIAQMTGETVDQADAIGKAFLDNGDTGIYGAQEIVDAFGPVSGQLQTTLGHALDIGDSLIFVAAATKLAEASGGDLTDTMAIMTQQMQNFRTPLGDVTELSDILFNVSKATNTPLSDLSSEFSKMLPKLGALNPTAKDLGGLLLDMKENTLSGGRAMMMMSSGLNTLSGPLVSAAGNVTPLSGELDKLHIHLYDANGQFVGMSGLFAQIIPKFQAMTPEARKNAEQIIFGKGAWEAFDQLIMRTNQSTLPESIKKVGESGSVNKAAADKTNTLAGKWDEFTASVGRGMLKVGDLLKGPALGVMTWLTTDLPNSLADAGRGWDILTGKVSNFMQSLPGSHGSGAQEWDPLKGFNAWLWGSGGGSGLGGSIQPGQGGFLSGAKATATGGIVTSAQTRLVGEAGPEAIIPLSKLPALMGTANSGGGGVSIGNVTINVKSSDPRQAAIEVRNELLNLARSQGRSSLLGSFA